jgi:hypothetical protein
MVLESDVTNERMSLIRGVTIGRLNSVVGLSIGVSYPSRCRSLYRSGSGFRLSQNYHLSHGFRSSSQYRFY